MIPIVTPAEMRNVDAAAPEPTALLIERAGAATASAALRLLGGAYGKRVLVIAGKGNNGNDGRAAARRLARRGVRVSIIEPGGGSGPTAGLPGRGPQALDLVIDAAYGTGFRGSWSAPSIPGVPVLAVDIPSGVDGLTGAAAPGPGSDAPDSYGSGSDGPGSSEPESGEIGVLAAVATITFAALKPGLVLLPGRQLAGRVTVADIGLHAEGVARAWRVTGPDVAGWVMPRPVDSHKWKAACWVVAGSPTMPGASHLCVRAAFRSGAGYVRLSSPGLDASPGAPTEAVYHALDRHDWAGPLVEGAARFSSVVIGPGLGRSPHGDASIRRAAAALHCPVVLDGDGLSAFADGALALLRDRQVPAVLTPHDGEFERVTGQRPGADRFEAARGLAATANAVVLLKGPTTVVADPAGRVGVSLAGDARLATAGSGDVLSGIIGALLAQGLEPWRAALAGAEVHGMAAMAGPTRGLVAGDLVDALPVAWAQLP